MSMGKFWASDRGFWLAYRNGQVVARLGLKLHQHLGERLLHFGFFEAMPGTGPEVAALFQEARRCMGIDLRVIGPHQFLLEDPYPGLLVNGFELEPYFFMNYNPPYYLELLEGLGFEKEMDLLTYRVTKETVRYPRLDFLKRRAQRSGLSIRNLDPSQLRREVCEIAGLFNAALAGNWGFEPIQGAQLEEFQLLARCLLLPETVFLAYQDQRLVGAVLFLPDLNPILKACGGGLNLTLVNQFRTRRRWLRKLRGYAVAVRHEFRNLGLLGLLLQHIQEAPGMAQIQECELGWVLEDNEEMRAVAEKLGCQSASTYRLLGLRP